VGNETRPFPHEPPPNPGDGSPKHYDDEISQGTEARVWKGVCIMLSLTLSPGEYVTIGDNVVVQFDYAEGGRCRLAFQAPREVPILRGEVRERNGSQRPDCVFDGARPCTTRKKKGIPQKM